MQARKIVIVALLTGCAAPPSSDWDPAAASALEGKIAGMFQALDSGNMDSVMTWADDEVVVYDFGPDNKPVSANGRAEAQAMFDGYAKAFKEGMKIRSTVGRTSCKASSTVGHCAVEFDQTMSAGGQDMGPFKFRGTMVARKVGEEWKWTHWHGSFREMPEMPPAAPPPLERVSMNAGDLKWAPPPPPAPQDVKVAVAWGDPGKGAFGAFFQFPKKFTTPMHHHGDANFRITVMQGGVKVSYADGTKHDVKAGGYFSEPAKVAHITEAPDGALFYLQSDGPFSLVPVDDKGNPLPPPAP